jgi:hypothetical protein
MRSLGNDMDEYPALPDSIRMCASICGFKMLLIAVLASASAGGRMLEASFAYFDLLAVDRSHSIHISEMATRTTSLPAAASSGSSIMGSALGTTPAGVSELWRCKEADPSGTEVDRTRGAGAREAAAATAVFECADT